MNIPAYTSPDLCLGRTYDAETSSPGNDIFPAAFPVKKINVNKFTFKYQVVKTNKDVKDLLDVSGELSLKIKGGLVSVEGAGQYLNETNTEEGKTELLAVMKCTTIMETMDGSAKPRENLSSDGLGTHYVRSVTYGAEMVASLKFKSETSSTKKQIKGNAEGNLNVTALDVGLKAQLDQLSSECSDVSDISIKYHATDLPDKLPTNLGDLIKLIEEFPRRLNNVNEGKGVPTRFELQPIHNIISTAKQALQSKVLASEIEDVESRLDDLRIAQSLVKKYSQEVEVLDDDVRKFSGEIRKVLRTFNKAISCLDKNEGSKEIEACFAAYEQALDGFDSPDKFVRHWRTLLKNKKPTTDLKLPKGRPLTVVLFGKTGNGKSSTGNTIVGEKAFTAGAKATSVTTECKFEKRKDERVVEVIDTPGVLDTTKVSMFGQMKAGAMNIIGAYSEDQKRILREVARVFALCPNGFHANILVVKYGCRFTGEDAHALKLLEGFFGPEANAYTILLLSYGEQAELHAEENNVTVDEQLKEWIESLPDWVKDFIKKKIGNRVVLFNNLLKVDKQPEAYKKQLSKLIEVIDHMTLGKGPFVHVLTHRSKDALEKQISQAMDDSGLTAQANELKKEKEKIEKEIKECEERHTKAKKDLEAEKEKQELQRKKWLNEKKAKELQQKQQELQEKAMEEQRRLAQKPESKTTEAIANEARNDGCFPGSAKFVDKNGRHRSMDSLKLGEEVRINTNKGIRSEPVITFIHRQPDVWQTYLRITTTKNKILKITEDHLLFVKTKGQATAVPARDVKIGDTLYVQVNDVIEEDTVQDISSVFEKGVYAPVTLSGTILVNDVLASCYFDVLSHEWSHMAMGIARTLYHVSPSVLQWISSIGQKDGFPGWCRLVHNMLTLLN